MTPVKPLRIRLMLSVAVLAWVLPGCSATEVNASPVATELQPTRNGWSFANFPSAAFPDINFGGEDLVSMFGDDPGVCVNGIASPCVLTAEAASWAQMVNQSRASGHCQGLAIIAAQRFNDGTNPPTAELNPDPDTVHAVTRAFATQFLPEVQQEAAASLGLSLKDKVAAMAKSFSVGKIDKVLGLYSPEGGHAVTPFAVEYPDAKTARVMVYDSNWPGRNRYVDVDLKNERWRFSFRGDDPANDPDTWTGGSGEMDLSSVSFDKATCPFCGSGTTVKNTTLVIRTDNPEWSVTTGDSTLSPESGSTADGAVVAKVKGGVSRGVFDYVVKIPAMKSSGVETSSRLVFPGSASIFALMPTGIARVETSGGIGAKVTIAGSSVSTTDPEVKLTLASGNLVASTTGSASSLSTEGGSMNIAMTLPSGEIVQQKVDDSRPTLRAEVDSQDGGLIVRQATATGQVEKLSVSADGTRTRSTTTEALTMNTVAVELPGRLASRPNPELPPPADRDLNNPRYRVDPSYKVSETAGAVARPTVAPTTTPPTTTIPQTFIEPTTPVVTTVPQKPSTTSTTTLPTTTTSTTTTTTTTTTSTTTTTTTTVPPPATFAATAGGAQSDTASNLLPLSDGSMLILGTHLGQAEFGSTTLSGGSDPTSYIARLSKTGSWMWAQNFDHGSQPPAWVPSGTAGGEVGALVGDVGPGDSLVVAGRFGGTLALGSTTLSTSCATGELFVAKMSVSRQWQWAVQSGGCAYNTRPMGLAASADGSVYVSGAFAYAPLTLGGTTLSDATARGFVARITPGGDWGWVKPLIASCEEARLETGLGGDVFVYGTCGLFGSNIWSDYVYSEGQANAVVAKLSSGGVWQWQTTVTSPNWVRGFVKGFRVQADGTIILAGNYGTGMNFGGTVMTDYGVYVARMSATGTWDWIRTGGAHNNYDGVSAVTVRPNGNIVVAAYYQQAGTPTYGSVTLTGTDAPRDIAVLELTSSGSWLSAMRIGKSCYCGWSVIEDPFGIEAFADGALILGGQFSSTNLSAGAFTLSTSGGQDIFIITL